MNNLNYIIDRLKEPSTWSAVSVLCGAVGYSLDVDYAMGIASAVFVIINVFWKRDTQSE